MAAIVDLAEWRRRRERPAGPSDQRVDSLERAVDRLHQVVGETELLAIMGELSMGGLDQAERRAERLTRRLLAGEGVLVDGSAQGSDPGSVVTDSSWRRR
jgi:hypothetical protein